MRRCDRGVSGALVFLVIVVALVVPRPAAATIEYRVSLEHPGQHLFHVTMEIPVEGTEVLTAMPAWNALYRVRDFSYRVEEVNGICSGLTAVRLKAWLLDKQTWRFQLEG